MTSIYNFADIQTKQNMIVFLLAVFDIVVGVEKCVNCLYGKDYCDPYTYQCTFGCKPGWKGSSCTDSCYLKGCKDCGPMPNGVEHCTSCQKGDVYGPSCNLDCSANCLGSGNNKDSCDHFGNCLFGCRRPYTGAKCEEQNCPFENCQRCEVGMFQETYCWQCVAGYYWQGDRQQCVQCSYQCLNGPTDCHSFTGTCASCKPGWFGDRCIHQCNIANCTNCGHKDNNVTCLRCKEGSFPAQNGLTCKSCDGQNCNGICSSITGDCLTGCKEGWFGEGYTCNRQCEIPNCAKCALTFRQEVLCLRCNDGYYVSGNGCNKCPEKCLSGCDANSAVCIGGCELGFYGEQCHQSCNQNCLNNICNASTGFCECKPNWYGHRCDRKCPIHCTGCGNFSVSGICASCEGGTYGLSCESQCSRNCKPRAYGGYTYCDQINGKCEDGCLNGFYGDNCDLECSPNCNNLNCDRNSGVCLNGCSQSHYGLKCEFRCPENCRHITAGYQRGCDSGSGRCVDGCAKGFYGEFCNATCSSRCKDDTCDQFNGDCILGCKTGYTGMRCDIICKLGCANNCSPNCYNGLCDPTTKLCTSGCNAGWYGSTCQEICSPTCVGRVCNQIDYTCNGDCVEGYYGGQCNAKCSENCVDVTCEKSTGSCIKGCRTGFHGDRCTEVCPEACVNGTCNRLTGACISCGIGVHGSKCDEDCLPGTYGLNCAKTCGRCRGNPCDVRTGQCPSGSGCEIGYAGSLCQDVLPSQGQTQSYKMNMDIVIGSSAAAAGVLCMFVVMILCWLKFRSKQKGAKSDEPVVIYRDAGVTIERASTSHPEGRDSFHSNTMLLGDNSHRLEIQLQHQLHKEGKITLYKGEMTNAGRKQKCVIKLVRLTDTEDKEEISRLMKETEIHTLCNLHINVIALLTSYQNTEVYCVAMETCMEVGLVPYLLKLSSSTEDGLQNPENIFRLLQFAIDICSAICHLHKLKVIHRMVQAHHVYLNENLVAKLGDFYWAEMMLESGHASSSAQTPLPDDSYPWLSPEAVVHDKFSFQSDIWCLGMLFWEIFSYGKQPFENVGRTDHKQMILDGIRPSKPVTAHFTLYRVMKNCWRYAVDDRPTAEQVLQQLIDIQGRFSDVEGVVVHV